MASEFDIIARHFAPIAGEGGLGLLDDAALIKPPPGHELVITTDAVVAGVHFFADDPPETIGHKALAVNLSDLAAKGAKPLGFVLSLLLAPGTEDGWLSAFSQGLGALARAAGCPLLGGDTVTTRHPLALSITAFGSVPEGRMVPRGGAREGDIIFVSGSIGDAAIGLKERQLQRAGKSSALSSDHASFLIERYLRPRPRNMLASAMQDYAHAAMDVSDGLIGDLTKMLALSGHGADVHLADVPHSVAARAAFRHDVSLRETVLTGGDDYELLVIVAPKKAKAFQTECLRQGVAVTAIGVVDVEGSPLRFLDGEGGEQYFSQPSFVHR